MSEANLDTTPKSDVIFKILFGNPKHPNLLISLLNSILDTEKPIVGVTIKQTELTPEFLMKKGVRLDVLAETSDGRLINIEIQKRNEHNMKERSLFHWSRIFSGQAVVSEKYENLKQTICINIVNFPLFEDGRYWHKNFLQDSETNEKLTDLLEIHFFELPKIKKRAADSPIMFWLEFINNPESEKIKSMYRLEPVYEEAKAAYRRAIADPNVQEMLRISEKADMDYKDAIAHASEKGREEGKAEGLEEGEKIGIEKGKAEERAKAKAEKIESAKKMLQDGLSVEVVSKYSGLSFEEVEKLS